MFTLLASRSVLRGSTARVTAAASLRCTRFYSSTMHDNDPETLELEKNRNLKGVQHKTSTPHAHAPGWNEPLASVSEASVKADQSSGTPSELQSRTVEYLRTRHIKDGEDSASSTSAFYSRDEVSGPLSGAQGKEDEVDLRQDKDDKSDKVVKRLKEELMTPSEQDVR
ncbi:hypothetical protein BYT27DRAFT_7183734 [Phlegmacium glaucopus]|nr:hypothetical protein BYT27DRAFT_7183734 [Phlegmacium glaucopus]